jgi:hypothetical protein
MAPTPSREAMLPLLKELAVEKKVALGFSEEYIPDIS